MLWTPHISQALIDDKTTLCWLRRDLRLEDNAALYYALKENQRVLPVFILDTQILDSLDEKADPRVEFILDSLLILKRRLEEANSGLLVIHGDPIEFYRTVNPKAVYTNHDYEPYARKRDDSVRKVLSQKNIDFKTYKDHVVFEKDEILKDINEPYKVFTPYSKKWKSSLTKFYLKSYPTEKYLSALKRVKPLDFPTLNDIGFQPAGLKFPPRIIKASVIKDYHRIRNFPATPGTSRLSVHLRFGTVSIRKLARIAISKNETWLNELIWRDFYQMILWHFPHVEKSFKPRYDSIRWRNNVDEFEAWCEGRTGYPIVDAGMRELNKTGFMHNRLRMITASFLTKHLLVDWRWGEAYFAKKLLDFDLAANNGGWQWAAGSGADSSPYFRIFNPGLQAKKFDPDLAYVKKWVPEWESANYPSPIVDHTFARARALKAYKDALL